MLTNIELTIDDREWPRLRLIVKHGVRVQTKEAQFEKASEVFLSEVSQVVSKTLEFQIQRRKSHGS